MINPLTVSNLYMRTVVHLAEQAGVTRAVLLTGVPVSEAELQAPLGRIAIGAACRLWQRAVDLTGDPELGLKFGPLVRPPVYHFLGQALTTCACLKDALVLMLRYQRLVSEAGTLFAEEQDDKIVISYLAQPNVALIPQQVEAIFSGLMCQTRWLAPSPIVPTAVSFAHSMQGQVDSYTQVFGILPTFDTSLTNALACISFHAHALTHPSPFADAALHRASCQAADRYIEQLPAVGFVSGFIRQWLQARPLNNVNFDDAAGALGSSVRSIQRQLQVEQSSWQSLLDLARRNAAHALLTQHLSLDQVAHEIGYHDASSLSRAIRRWAGTTPKEWLEKRSAMNDH